MSGPRRKPWRAAVRFAVSAALLLLVARFVDLGDVGGRLSELHAGWVVLGLAVSALQIVLLGWRWSYTVGRLGVELPTGVAIAEYWLGVLLNQILPGGVTGDVSRAWRHSRQDVPARPVVTAVVLERASAQVVMTTVGVASLLTLPWGPGWLRLGIGLVLGVWGALVVRLVVRRTRSRPEAPSGPSGAAGSEESPATDEIPAPPASAGFSADARRALLGDALPVQLGTAVLVVASYIAVFLFAARGVGVDTPTLQLLPLVAPVLMTMLVPVTVAGWGIREAAAAGLWGLVGLTPADGAAIAVAYGVLVLLASLPGALVLISLRSGGRDRRGRPPPG